MFKKLFGFLLGGDKKAAAAKVEVPADIEAGDLQGFVEFVVKSLVDHPEEMEIIPEQNEDHCALRIRCHKDDRGKIIGKRGKTITAIRALVSGAAGRQHKRVSVDVLD
jgi:predicted RNA-binding protein YlqC (UPF0109 family)